MSNDTANVLQFPNKGFSSGASSSEGTLSYSKESHEENKHPVDTGPIKQPIVTDDLLIDLQELSAMALREKYSRESNSHKNRKAYCKKSGGVFAPDFQDFRNFMRLVGVIPGSGKWTLDRTDNTNPDYFPGGVRWACAKTQNNNKSDTILLTYKAVTRPLSEWASITGQNAATLRKRHQRGWSDHQILYGKQNQSQNQYCQGVWRELVPDRPDASYELLERSYHRTRFLDESRHTWLAGVARNHIENLKDRLIAADYAGKPDVDGNAQHDAWTMVQCRLGSPFFVPHHMRTRALPRFRFVNLQLIAHTTTQGGNTPHD